MRLPQVPQTVALAVVATGVSAVLWDLRTRRIPNALTLGSAVLGVAFHGFASGGLHQGFVAGSWSAAGWLVGLLLFLPIYLLRGLGAGDLKLLAAFGAWLGPSAAFWVAVYAGIAGGVLAVPVLLARRAVRRTAVNLWGLVGFWRVAGIRPHPGLTLESPGAIRMPYALPIAIGAVLAMWWRT